MFPINMTSVSDLFSSTQLIIYFGISILNGILLYFCSMKFMLVMQQCGYRGKRYFKWLDNRETPYKSRLMLLSMLGFLFFLVLSMCFSSVTGGTASSYVGFAAYFLFIALYINTESHVNAKVPLKKTKRLVRLAVTFGILLTLVTFALSILCNYVAFKIGDEVFAILRYALICIMPILTPYILFLAYVINEPMEKLIRDHYIKKARIKLEKSNVIKVGITGSFGKTTVKEMLKTILSQKYRVLATPENYNTPLGIALTAKGLDASHDIFIAEMGARSKGDIKELANIVKPKYGVITGINEQHLESFETIENIKDTKYELVENLTSDGVAFFSSDNEGSLELFNRYQGEKILAGNNIEIESENGLVTATDIVTDKQGTSFMLCIRGHNPVKCRTVLLGKFSISNICLASSVAYQLGMTPSEIANGINRLTCIGHRLELMPNNKGIIIIDDSYNCNIDGTKAAMEVMDMFEGRKIVLTPGLVELGKIENVANFEFGKLLASHADIVIITGKHNAVMIIDGLIEGGMARENIIFAKNLKKGNEELNAIMQQGDVVMFENDLPDNYN